MPAVVPPLERLIPSLRCPVCSAGLAEAGEQLACTRGHTFDLARQGYVNLTVGSSADGDTSAMVQARERFLGGDHYLRLAAEIAALVATSADPLRAGLIADLGGGTGYYLAATLDALPGWIGVCLDRAAAALRRAARAHPRAAAVGCDVWRGLPLADGCVDVVLDIFAPRNGGEIRRVLAPSGRAVIVTPTPRHLHEVVQPLGMPTVDPHKQARLATDLVGLDRTAGKTLEYAITLDRHRLLDLVLMGPTARHATEEEIIERTGILPEPITVTISVDLAVWTVDRVREGS